MTYTKLHDACMRPNAQEIAELLESNPYMAVEQEHFYQTPLHILCGLQNPDITSVLTIIHEVLACMKIKDSHGDTPLHVACRSPDASPHLVHLLVEHDPTVAAVANKEGLMPLHVACRYNAARVIGLLLEEFPGAARVRIKMGSLVRRQQHDKAMHAVIDTNHAMSRKTYSDMNFEQAGEQIRDGSYPLHMALRAGALIDVVEMLMKAEPDVLLLEDKYGATPLHVACAVSADENVLRTLLEHGPQAARRRDHRGNLPIHHMVAEQEISVHAIKYLWAIWPAMVAERNQNGLTALDVASCNNACSPKVLELLEIMSE